MHKVIIKKLMILLIIGNIEKKLKDKKIINMINNINNLKIQNIFKKKRLQIMKLSIKQLSKNLKNNK